jgi:hypothetical protein
VKRQIPSAQRGSVALRAIIRGWIFCQIVISASTSRVWRDVRRSSRSQSIDLNQRQAVSNNRLSEFRTREARRTRNVQSR